jgi:hypothetical protein
MVHIASAMVVSFRHQAGLTSIGKDYPYGARVQRNNLLPARVHPIIGTPMKSMSYRTSIGSAPPKPTTGAGRDQGLA